MYWQTLYRVARLKGQSDEQARDSVQDFICYLYKDGQTFQHVDPNRGRFRNFLWTRFNWFLVDAHRAANRQKAGGHMQRHSIDSRSVDGGILLEPVENLTPHDAFRKSLALDTFQEAFDQLEAAWSRKGQAVQFSQLRAYLAEDCKGSRAATLARQLGVSEARARGRVAELRQQFGQILRHCVAQTLSTPSATEIESELDWLWESLSL
jgi:DNA-directed RNA polymerase specialized sigma24 family protein